MKKSHLIGAVCAVVFSLISMSSHAALTLVLGGQAVYDDEADLTWTRNASINGPTNSWEEANAWAESLDIDGVAGPDGWRLPSALNSDGTFYCNSPDCDSELGNLFYNVMDGFCSNDGCAGGYVPGPITFNENYDLFDDIQGCYVTDKYIPDTTYFIIFCFNTGIQYPSSGGYLWAVQSGNVYPSASVKLSALVNLVMGMNLQAGISNALDSKLSNALSAIDDDNANNDGAVLNMMYAFCSSSEAQRGKKLTDAQTDELIAAANGIIVLLDEYATPCE